MENKLDQKENQEILEELSTQEKTQKQLDKIQMFKKLSNIRKSIATYLQKKGQAGGGDKDKNEKSNFGFNYVSSSQVLENVNNAINENGLLLFPKITKQEVTKQNQYQTILTIQYTWIDSETGFEYEVSWFGQGLDSGEKGLGKALTYAEKYFILKFFNIATDKDDPDAVANKQIKKEIDTGLKELSKPKNLLDLENKFNELVNSYKDSDKQVIEEITTCFERKKQEFINIENKKKNALPKQPQKVEENKLVKNDSKTIEVQEFDFIKKELNKALYSYDVLLIYNELNKTYNFKTKSYNQDLLAYCKELKEKYKNSEK